MATQAYLFCLPSSGGDAPSTTHAFAIYRLAAPAAGAHAPELLTRHAALNTFMPPATSPFSASASSGHAANQRRRLPYYLASFGLQLRTAVLFPRNTTHIDVPCRVKGQGDAALLSRTPLRQLPSRQQLCFISGARLLNTQNERWHPAITTRHLKNRRAALRTRENDVAARTQRHMYTWRTSGAA